MTSGDIFDRRIRRLRRARVFSAKPGDQWLIERMASELRDRWLDEAASARRALIIGYDVGVIRTLLLQQGAAVFWADPSPGPGQNVIQCDEDRLPFADGAFDAIFWVGTLDSVNDVPGALVLIRRALAPTGLFLGAFLGGGSLTTLRSITVSPEDSPAIARLHPQIDVRSAGDLLSRAGFHQPVADAEVVTARYSTLARLIADIRANGLSNVLLNRPNISRQEQARWNGIFDSLKDSEGKASECFALIYLTGFSPNTERKAPAPAV
jgi:NADH dehydrogenase [ubiquinone] 1 alpha subcomplex assembly factor 5